MNPRRFKIRKAENPVKSRLSALFVARLARFERAAFRLGGGPSILLRYRRIYQIFETATICRGCPGVCCNATLGGGRSILLSYGCKRSIHNGRYYTASPPQCQMKPKDRSMPVLRIFHSPKLMPMFLAMRTISWSRGTNFVLPATSERGLCPTSAPCMPTACP